jgi:hypothetical protein
MRFLSLGIEKKRHICYIYSFVENQTIDRDGSAHDYFGFTGNCKHN